MLRSWWLDNWIVMTSIFTLSTRIGCYYYRFTGYSSVVHLITPRDTCRYYCVIILIGNFIKFNAKKKKRCGKFCEREQVDDKWVEVTHSNCCYLNWLEDICKWEFSTFWTKIIPLHYLSKSLRVCHNLCTCTNYIEYHSTPKPLESTLRCLFI